MDRRELPEWMVATGGLAALDRPSRTDLLTIGRAAHGAHTPHPRL